MRLKLKHLAPYFPYGLQIYCEGMNGCESFKWTLLTNNIEGILGYKNKPILRPLSDLINDDFKEELYQYYQTLGIDVKLVNYDSVDNNPFDTTLTVTYKLLGDVFTEVLISRGSTSETPYHIFDWLCENHFDVFGLIEKELAINMNKIK